MSETKTKTEIRLRLKDVTGPMLGAIRLTMQISDMLLDRGRISEYQHSKLLAGILNEIDAHLELIDPPIGQTNLPDEETVAFIAAWWDAFGDQPVYPWQLERLDQETKLLGRSIGYGSKRSRTIRLGILVRQMAGREILGYRIDVLPKDRNKQSRYCLNQTQSQEREES